MVILNNISFRQALNMWFLDEVQATKTYGDISEWNTSEVTDMSSAFQYKTTFNSNISYWNTSKVTNMSSMFNFAQAFNNMGNPLRWDTSNVNNMVAMFQNADMFNQNISSWNTSKVTDMSYMFIKAINFNNGGIGSRYFAPINPLTWNTSNVNNMVAMFQDARVFNQNISSWNTSKVTSMNNMFYAAKYFNNGDAALATDGNKWNTSNVTNMDGMFHTATDFNQNIGSWNIFNVVTMTVMFLGAKQFKGLGLDTWTFATLKPFILNMFSLSAVPYSINNRKIWNSWLTQNYTVTELIDAKLVETDPPIITSNAMLKDAIINWFEVNNDYIIEDIIPDHYTTYFGPIDDWQFGPDVTSMKSLFSPENNDYPQTVKDIIAYFNKNISSWNTSNVLTMEKMFYKTTFFNNGQRYTGAGIYPLKWNTSNVLTMELMFYDDFNFNQDIGSWNTSKTTKMDGMFGGATAYEGAGLDTWTFATPKPTIPYMFTLSAVPTSVNNGKIWNAWKLKGYDNNELIGANLNAPRARSMSLVSGWNLIGTTQPLFLNNRDNISYIYGLSGGSFKLITDNQLAAGGYWLYWNAAGGEMSAELFQTEQRTISVVSGWNLIGNTVPMAIIGGSDKILYIYGLQGGSFQLKVSNSVLSAGGYWVYWNDTAAGVISIVV